MAGLVPRVWRVLLRNTCAALYSKVITPVVVLDKGDRLCLSKLFIHSLWGFIWLIEGETFPRKVCLGREAHWLDTWSLSRYLISVENSALFIIVLVTCSRTCNLVGRGFKCLLFLVMRFFFLNLLHHTSSSVWWQGSSCPTQYYFIKLTDGTYTNTLN